jgi:hypothetical protein
MGVQIEHERQAVPRVVARRVCDRVANLAAAGAGVEPSGERRAWWREPLRRDMDRARAVDLIQIVLARKDAMIDEFEPADCAAPNPASRIQLRREVR